MMNCDPQRNKPVQRSDAAHDRRQVLRLLAAGAFAGATKTLVADDARSDWPGTVEYIPSLEKIRASDPTLWKLVDLINTYRRSKGLPSIALSRRLTVVAGLHARDLATQVPQGENGSMHSWSIDARWIGGEYRAADKSTWPIMWDKPKEITGYNGYGFEIAAAKIRDTRHALSEWQKSPSHLDVILNRGVWDNPRWQWKALGAVWYRGYACAWFGDEPDV